MVEKTRRERQLEIQNEKSQSSILKTRAPISSSHTNLEEEDPLIFILKNEDSSVLKNKTLFVEQKNKGTNSSNLEIDTVNIGKLKVKKYISEYWTSKQRQASSIHEISYRACFKPQLPSFFIKRFTLRGDLIYDPFSGRGTTVVEAGLLGRNVILNDISPLSTIFAKPRFELPEFSEIQSRLMSISLEREEKAETDLSMFYHKKTELELVSLRKYLKMRKDDNEEDAIDRWIRLVATNRLTGHSKGFFSVYTLPPNQAASQKSQIKINERKNQHPEYRDIKQLILKKTKALYRNLTSREKNNLIEAGKKAIFLQKDARDTSEIGNEVVHLTVTSPPFLNIVSYDRDNWLRCWFNSIDVEEINKKITMAKNVKDWSNFMRVHFQELFRITRKDGHVCFEVGEVNHGRTNLDEFIVPVGVEAGFRCRGILINSQKFTKTSNIWGISNNKAGTNTNRIVIFQKE